MLLASPSLFFRSALLALALTAPAIARPVLVQQHACAAITTCAFTNPPHNGNLVSIQMDAAASIGTTTIKDSNNFSLFKDQPAVSCVTGNLLCFSEWDYIVTGTPTATYTLAGFTLGFANGGEMWEWSGVNNSTNSSNVGNSITSLTTALVASNPFTTQNDAMECISDYISTTGTSTTVLANGQIGTSATAAYGVATSATTTTCTNTAATGTQTSAFVFFEDYPETPPTGAWVGGFIPQPDWRAFCAKAA